MRLNLSSFLLLLLLAPAASAVDWRPVNPSELAQKTPRVDATADAEAIFWDVYLEDRLDGGDLSLAMRHYVRLKIFTERGKEQYATVEIPRYGKRSISDVAARTIKANGDIIDLKKDSIFDRELAHTKGLKVRGKTFALPNVEVGDIIEYQYKETRNGEVASHMRLYFQRDIPTWTVAYHLKPLNVPFLPFGMRSMAFQCKLPPFQKEPNGFYSTTMTDVPAFKPEPNMPPEDSLRAWILIYYEEDKKIDAEKFWKETGKQDYARFKPLTKADDSVKRTAAELISGADKPADKVAALDTFCRTKIRNVSSSALHLTADERKAVKENHSPSDTLKQKAGRGMDIDFLFAALATAAGFEARIARVPDRGDIFFSPKLPTTYFLENLDVAVKVGEEWLLFDPATPYLGPGMLRWQEEGEKSLISDPKEGFFVSTQYSDPERSKRLRRGSFQLREDGTLEGTVEYRYTGHAAREQKLYYEDMTPSQQEQDWKETLQRRISTAEMSDFSMQDAGDLVKPMVVRHKVTIPGYATRTGKRILLQPAFFQHNQSPRFSETTRRYDMYFEYGWSEDDEVTIELPEGWELDAPQAPSSTKLSNVGDYAVSAQKTTDGRKLIYRRHFDWGRNNLTVIPAASYPQVKNAFDFIHNQDAYTVSLKAATK